MNAQQVIKLDSAFDITQVELLKEQFDACLNASVVTLDAERVERCDTSSLQLCYAFWRYREQKGLETEWKNPSVALSEQAQLMGMREWLKLPCVQSIK